LKSHQNEERLVTGQKEERLVNGQKEERLVTGQGAMYCFGQIHGVLQHT
jgi:hypothetical protein